LPGSLPESRTGHMLEQFPSPRVPHDHSARSRHRSDHSAAAAARSRCDDTTERTRCAPRARRRRAAVPPPPVQSVDDTQVQGAAGALAARVYRVSREQSPTVVFFHGGGWVAGDLESHDRHARPLTIETGAVVISVDYRRPPETRFPGAFEDGFAAMRDVIARIAEFGGDPAHVRVAGDSDSAGGNLAA